MEHKVHNHTKEYSTAIILHAVAKAKFDGESQKDIADLLGVDPTNIPKYKSGEQKLSRTNINLIIEKYGCPKLAEGEYMQAIMCDSVDHYINSNFDRAKNYLAITLSNFFRDINVLNHLAYCVSSCVLKEDSESEFGFSFRTKYCSKEDIPAVLSWLKIKLTEDAFNEWYQKCSESSFKSSTSHNRRDSLLPKLSSGGWSKSFVSGKDLALFYLLGYFIKEVEPSFDFNPNKDQQTSSTSLTEVVITGESILNFEANSGLSHSFHAINMFTKHYPEPRHEFDYGDIDLSDEPQLINKFKSLNSFAFQKAHISLNMNSEMVYRIVIDENWGNFSHKVVITTIRQDLVIEEYKKLSKFFGLEPAQEFDLKAAIAARGGFIPGTTLL